MAITARAGAFACVLAVCLALAHAQGPPTYPPVSAPKPGAGLNSASTFVSSGGSLAVLYGRQLSSATADTLCASLAIPGKSTGGLVPFPPPTTRIAGMLINVCAGKTCWVKTKPGACGGPCCGFSDGSIKAVSCRARLDFPCTFSPPASPAAGGRRSLLSSADDPQQHAFMHAGAQPADSTVDALDLPLSDNAVAAYLLASDAGTTATVQQPGEEEDGAVAASIEEQEAEALIAMQSGDLTADQLYALLDSEGADFDYSTVTSLDGEEDSYWTEGADYRTSAFSDTQTYDVAQSAGARDGDEEPAFPAAAASAATSIGPDDITVGKYSYFLVSAPAPAAALVAACALARPGGELASYSAAEDVVDAFAASDFNQDIDGIVWAMDTDSTLYSASHADEPDCLATQYGMVRVTQPCLSRHPFVCRVRIDAAAAGLKAMH